MSLTAQMSNEITRIQQMMARYDDAGREIYGAFAVASRLFEMEPDYSGPKLAEDGSFLCKFTDDDLVAHFPKHKVGDEEVYTVTAQEFAQAFFGALQIANSIPMELADLIGRIRA